MPPDPSPTPAHQTFAELRLPPALLQALSDVGYETPSPIQAATVPPLLAGRDVVGQAQTGTGKTAAFALPILAKLDLSRYGPQALVLTPTRELAIQVAEAFHKYARHLRGFHVLPIYGGQAYGPQLGALRRGTHVVVGTPGRVIDHLERGTLDLGQLSVLVLDEGDEMLRMGFIDDVETVLQKTPAGRQVALFSATMPPEIRRIAKKHLNDPAEITIRNKTSTAANTRQRYWVVSGVHKLEALTRILEVEPFEAMIIFARTKIGTEELAERLEARGFAAAALNGDMPQAQRERTIAKLKCGELDILVATDVAARGLDVERVTHVLNYDIPYDTEAYIHRIGRTGRAGRKGEAILFVTWREQHLLRSIERTTRQPIEPMTLPSVAAVNDTRVAKFKLKITEALASPDLSAYEEMVAAYEQEHGVPASRIAAAIARLAQGAEPLLVPAVEAETRKPDRKRRDAPDRGPPDRPPARRPAAPAHAERDGRAAHPEPAGDRDPRNRAQRPVGPPRAGMLRYRLAVGQAHGVRPGNIVGAIANEAGLENQYIGRVDIREDHSLVDLPEGMPPDVLRHLQKVWVMGRQLRIVPDGQPFEGGDDPGERAPARKGKPSGQFPGKPAKAGKPGKRLSVTARKTSSSVTRNQAGKRRFTPGMARPGRPGKPPKSG